MDWLLVICCWIAVPYLSVSSRFCGESGPLFFNSFLSYTLVPSLLQRGRVTLMPWVVHSSVAMYREFFSSWIVNLLLCFVMVNWRVCLCVHRLWLQSFIDAWTAFLLFYVVMSSRIGAWEYLSIDLYSTFSSVPKFVYHIYIVDRLMSALIFETTSCVWELDWWLCLFICCEILQSPFGACGPLFVAQHSLFVTWIMSVYPQRGTPMLYRSSCPTQEAPHKLSHSFLCGPAQPSLHKQFMLCTARRRINGMADFWFQTSATPFRSLSFSFVQAQPILHAHCMVCADLHCK